MNLLFINPETDLASQHAISYLYFQLLPGVNRVYLCFSFFFGRGLSNKQPEAELIQQVMSCSSPGKHTNLLGCRSISVSGLVSLLVLQSRPTAAQGHSGGCVTPIEAEQGRRSKSLVCLLTKFRKNRYQGNPSEVEYDRSCKKSSGIHNAATSAQFSFAVAQLLPVRCNRQFVNLCFQSALPNTQKSVCL